MLYASSIFLQQVRLDLRASALVGCDESYGTYVVGDAIVDRAALLWNHHLGVVGTFSCDDWAHDECDSRADVATILSSLGQSETDYGFNLAAVRETLSALPMPVHDDARSKVDFIQAITASELETPLAPDPHADLRTWIGEFSGNQRQLLKALREEWKQRLATRDSEEIVRILRKAIKSPKLRAQRDCLPGRTPRQADRVTTGFSLRRVQGDLLGGSR